jgi:maleamate amidohydrolase
MSDADVYRKQQFGQKTGFGSKPALLVVDFVNGFHDPEILGGGNIAEAVIATVPLLGFFRATERPVIFTRIVYAEDGSDTSLWCEKVPRLRDLTENADASQVVASLAPRAGELVIRKTQASAFFGTHLGACLVSKGVDTLVVAGCTTSGCVRASVIDAMSMNYRTVVASDCVGDRALGPHAANLFDMGQKYADLLTATEIIEALGTSRT